MKNMKVWFIWVILGSIFFLSTGSVVAEETQTTRFEKKLTTIEERTLMLHMIMKQLSHVFSKAKKDHTFMVEQGLDPKEVQRLESAYQRKIQQMINDAVAGIDHL